MKLKVPPLPPSTDEYLMAQLADAKWMPAEKLESRIPPGGEIALIGADPDVDGDHRLHAASSAAIKLPAHAHTHTSWLTTLSGKGTWTIDGKKTASTVGTFVIVHSKQAARVHLRRRRRLASSCCAVPDPPITSGPASSVIIHA